VSFVKSCLPTTKTLAVSAKNLGGTQLTRRFFTPARENRNGSMFAKIVGVTTELWRGFW
jgi:hypothetical protein